MEVMKKGSTIQSLQIGIEIVDLIAQQRRPLKFTDIHDLTQITKSNLYKYLNTLTQSGILYREKESGTYVLGSKLIEYGMAAADQENVIERIAPYLQEINEKSASTVLYSIWTPNGPMIVSEFNANRGFNIGAQMGTLLPLFSATGKLFATFMAEPMIQEWREKECRQTPEKAALLEQECQFIREHKISFAREPLVSSVSSVAIPVFNYKKKLLGAVTIVGFSEFIPQNEKEELSLYLMDMSIELSESFGYKPQTETK